MRRQETAQVKEGWGGGWDGGKKVMKHGNKEGKRKKETDREMKGRAMQRHRDRGGSIVRGNTERRQLHG